MNATTTHLTVRQCRRTNQNGSAPRTSRSRVVLDVRLHNVQSCVVRMHALPQFSSLPWPAAGKSTFTTAGASRACTLHEELLNQHRRLQSDESHAQVEKEQNIVKQTTNMKYHGMCRRSKSSTPRLRHAVSLHSWRFCDLTSHVINNSL